MAIFLLHASMYLFHWKPHFLGTGHNQSSSLLFLSDEFSWILQYMPHYTQRREPEAVNTYYIICMWVCVGHTFVEWIMTHILTHGTLTDMIIRILLMLLILPYYLKVSGTLLFWISLQCPECHTIFTISCNIIYVTFRLYQFNFFFFLNWNHPKECLCDTCFSLMIYKLQKTKKIKK